MQLSFYSTDEQMGKRTEHGTYANDRERLEKKYAPLMSEELRLAHIVSYVGNKKVPFLRLYRYKEAFAFQFVNEIIARFGLTDADYVLDPFCGMGTTLFTAAQHNIASIGIDRLPIGVFVACTIPLLYTLQPGELRETFACLKSRVSKAVPAEVALDVAIMKVAYPPDTLHILRQWKTAIEGLDSPLKEAMQLLLLSILEPCSYTSKDGQFLRLLRNKQTAHPTEALEQKVYEAERDIQLVRELGWNQHFRQPEIYLGDTRNLHDIPFGQAPTALITSPPYANRYDYTRSYSLELCFQFVKNFKELKTLRFGVLRSHIEAKVGSHEQPSHPTVQEVVNSLRERAKSLNNPRIPDMLVGYFVDMEAVIQEWARVLARGAKVAMVVDNVRFDGELLPVDLVLSEMAECAGFEVEAIWVARYKGNSSQQMGKYGRVPVRESVVIWRKQRRNYS
jgi:hypothetical protein